MECASPYCGRDLSQSTKHNLWQPYCGRYCKVFHRSGRTYDSRLTDTQIEIFEALKAKKSFPSRSHLADYMGKTRATVNESVLNMERYGWIADTSLQVNGENKKVKLTRKGRAYCKEGYPDNKRLPLTAPCDGCDTGLATMYWGDPRKANQTFCSSDCYHTNVCGSARKGARNYTVLKILRAKGPVTAKEIAYELEKFNTLGSSIRVANILQPYTGKNAVFKEEYGANKYPNLYFWTGNVKMHQLFNPKS
jgi:DNA-binding MarR family transcriptional regulator